jgi:hypothetical protein
MDCFVAAAPRNDARDEVAPYHRHCERSEAIHRSASADHAWIASSLLLAMTAAMFNPPSRRCERTRLHIPAARLRPGACMKLSPNEGVGNAGCRSHPQPRMQNKKAYELVTTGPPAYPAFPHAMVLTAYFALFPVIGLPCHRRLANVTCPRPVGPTRLRKT